MQTHFTPTQLDDPNIREADAILRKCVHCGFCTATCPTFVLLGDELDSPRGRIVLIKDMLENDKPASATVARHVDRCLSCLACVTTCPSGVDYMHLVDQARARIERTFRRPWPERLLRELLARVLPHPLLLRLALVGAFLAKPLRGLLPARLAAMLALAPASIPAPSPVDRPQVFPARGPRRKRVALLSGCANPALRPRINEATVRLLTRLGCEVAVAEGAGCCGALAHHLGRERDALAAVKANVAAWERLAGAGGLDAIVVNASGCGTMVKDYGHLLRLEAAWAQPAARVAALARDVSEIALELGFAVARAPAPLTVAYQSPCSMRHGQKLVEEPKRLLAACGFRVVEPLEAHLCCGSAGTYNVLQPKLARDLRGRKAAHLERLRPDVVATANIGCLVQLRGAMDIPVVHAVELLDWAAGGPRPEELISP